MTQLKIFWRSFFQRAGFVRTCLEATALNFLVTLFSRLIYGALFDSLYPMTLLFCVNPLTALYYGLRLNPARGGKLRQTGIELFWLGIISALLTVLGFYFALHADKDATGTGAFRLILFLVASTMSFPYYFFRILSRLWVWWAAMRQRHLIWSLMSSHLVAVGLLEGAIITPLILHFVSFNDTSWTLLNLPDNLPGQVFFRITSVLPIVGVSILGSMTVLIALLPASALVSYFFARRIKQRLDVLIIAAQAARDADYQVRVPISGQDEIARLQSDFNAMIASLESHVNDLRGEQEKVAALLRLRRDLLANVSHELRTPVATIRAYLESARRDAEALDADTLDIVERETGALQTLIDDLFTLSRAETDRLSLKVEATHLPALIYGVVETAAPLAWRTGRVEVSAQVPAWLPPVQADAVRLEQALRNLVHNSLRHTLPGGIVVISAQQNGASVAIQVRDTGEGITSDDLPHIWERFYRGAKHGGSGLGLALVKAFIEAMGGQVAVESIPGEGACFTLTLPLSGSAPESTLPTPVPVARTVRL